MRSSAGVYHHPLPDASAASTTVPVAVLDTVVASATARVSDKVVAPVTPSVLDKAIGPATIVCHHTVAKCEQSKARGVFVDCVCNARYNRAMPGRSLPGLRHTKQSTNPLDIGRVVRRLGLHGITSFFPYVCHASGSRSLQVLPRHFHNPRLPRRYLTIVTLTRARAPLRTTAPSRRIVLLGSSQQLHRADGLSLAGEHHVLRRLSHADADRRKMWDNGCIALS